MLGMVALNSFQSFFVLLEGVSLPMWLCGHLHHLCDCASCIFLSIAIFLGLCLYLRSLYENIYALLL